MIATPPTVEHTMAAMMPPESLLPPESPSGGGMYPVVEQETLTTFGWNFNESRMREKG